MVNIQLKGNTSLNADDNTQYVKHSVLKTIKKFILIIFIFLLQNLFLPFNL